MYNISDYIEVPPFSLAHDAKRSVYLEALNQLHRVHYAGNGEYRRIAEVTGFVSSNDTDIDNFPMLPVRLFKEYDLRSVDSNLIIKTMTSSGTSGQSVSKIFLDKNTAVNQTKVLTKILSSFLGNKRLPMLIVDTKAVLKNRNLYSARGAGIVGFSMLGHNLTYALKEDMTLDEDAFFGFIEKYGDGPVLIFGFTFMVWQYFLEALKKHRKVNLKEGILIHGGGWKKLLDQEVDNLTFKQKIQDSIGVRRVHNYYGMVEQTGSIFMECEKGYLHSSIFSEVIVRSHRNFEKARFGERGLIQLLSLLPTSYPGYSILTEDIGEIIGEDDCECGRLGKYFLVHGRVKNAEIRGCSDTFS